MSLRLPISATDLRSRIAALIPCACALCAKTQDQVVCTDCREQYFKSAAHRCRQCAATLVDRHAIVCGDCVREQPAYDATIVAGDYAPPIDQLVLSLKFGGRLALAPFFAAAVHSAIRAAAPDAMPDLLIAVPLGKKRLGERGFNQALEIAKPLARALNIPLAARAVVRIRETTPQALLHIDERRANLRQAFTVCAPAVDTIKGRHVGIVDDVITTGETLSALAATLKRFGAARVTNLVFARTLSKKD